MSFPAVIELESSGQKEEEEEKRFTLIHGKVELEETLGTDPLEEISFPLAAP